MHSRPFEQRPHENAVKRLIVLHGRPEIDVETATASVSDEDETSLDGKRGQGGLQGRSNGVNHEINSPAIGQPTDFPNNILLKSIDDM